MDTNGLRWVGEKHKVQSAVNNLRNGGGMKSGDSDMDTDSDCENVATDRKYSVAWSPLDDRASNTLGSKGVASNLSREKIQLRMAREFGRNQAIYPVFTEFELSDSITSTELPFRQTKSNNGGARKGSYNSSGNIETTSKNKLSNSNPITPPLYGSVSEIERVVEPSSLIRAYNTAHTSNWSVPANTNGLRKTKSVYSSSPMHYSFGNGTSNSPVCSPARLPGTWCAVIAYDACVRLCLHAWAQSYCAEVQGFLENESALLRDAFGL
ncbi:hypothetical protein ACFX13_000489 [Malus domestica]